MKILFIGDILVAQRFQLALAKEDLTIISDPNRPLIPGLIEQNKFDMVIVDSLMRGAEEICHRIHNLATVPVVLMVDDAEKSWKSVLTFDADAFITQHDNNLEILARIAAVYRRSKRTQTTKDRSLLKS
jgi:DNA-binding response OmpR family regulator